MYQSQKRLLRSEDAAKLALFIENIRCRECSHYVGKNPYAYDGNVYCEDCGDAFNEEEKKRCQEEIDKLEKRLCELRERQAEMMREENDEN